MRQLGLYKVAGAGIPSSHVGGARGDSLSFDQKLNPGRLLRDWSRIRFIVIVSVRVDHTSGSKADVEKLL